MIRYLQSLINFLEAKPLLNLHSKTISKNGKIISWAEYGVDSSLADHTVLYMHGTPMCRLEPTLHSMGSIDKNIYFERKIRLCCFERPGFGNNPITPTRKVADFVDDIKIALDSQEFDIRPDSKFYVIGFSAGGPYALAVRSILAKRVKRCAVIASSVSSFEDSIYGKSYRGQLEQLFFSLPFSVQTNCYKFTIQSFCFFVTVARKAIQTNAFMSFYDTKSIDLKLSAIIDILQESTKLGFSGITQDTIVNQSASNPWGFSLHSNGSLDTEALPPVLMYYSKTDNTVPVSAGVRLSKLLTGGDPVWLDGGHLCWYFNLQRVIDDCIEP